MNFALPHEQPHEGVSVLAVGLRPEEREALARYFAGAGSRVRFLGSASLAEAWPAVEAGQIDAIVCDWSVFLLLRNLRPIDVLDADGVAVVALVPPGQEEASAALLLESDPAAFVLRAGNYLVWLPAVLQRLLRRQTISWEEVVTVLRHEINNPLTGVLGNAELVLAESGEMAEKQSQRLRTIIHLCLRLRDVVHGLELRLMRDDPPRPRPARADSPPTVRRLTRQLAR
jgi:signal transduction histidine kinase